MHRLHGIGVRPEDIVNEGADHVPLEALLVIRYVIGDRQDFRHATGVVNVVDGAASSLHLLRHAILTRQPALVLKLHGETDEVVSFSLQHGRDGG